MHILRLAVSLLTFFLYSSNIYSKTIFVEGSSVSLLKVRQEIYFDVVEPVEELSFRFALPIDYQNLTNRQTVKSLNLNYSVKPYKAVEVKDKFGNRFIEATWIKLNKPVNVSIEYVVEKTSLLSKNTKPQTLEDEDTSIYLLPTRLVQSNSSHILKLAKSLAEQSRDRHQLVENIINFVSDNIKYISNPKSYDAVWTLENKIGNCQNFAHLAIALLRAVGIPARIVGGITVKEPWEIKLRDKTIKYSMGQGGHAWIEVYFPDTGWVEYDPQQTKYFASTRHIRQTHGLDSEDINDRWSASPYLPSYTENISYQVLDDKQDYKFLSEKNPPRSYIASLYRGLVDDKKDYDTVKDQLKYKKIDIPEKEFGNISLQNFIEFYKVTGNTGYKTFDRETAELMTKSKLFAQGFKIEKETKIKSISLGLRRFGGEGKVFIFLAFDNNGKPSDRAIKSVEIDADFLSKRGGYYWVEFFFDRDVILKPGRYWIVFGFTGDVIVNWLYTPGNPYGDEDDTLSTSLDFKWDSVHNIDFVFKVNNY